MYETTKNLPFFYTTMDMENLNLALECKLQPVQEEIKDIWTTIDTPATDSPLRPLFAANILQSLVAFKSRRAMGNILFVPTQEQADWYTEKYNEIKRLFQILVDSTLEKNELRCTYWKIYYNQNNEETAVDGGIQLSPEGYSYNPNYKRYFVRTFT